MIDDHFAFFSDPLDGLAAAPSSAGLVLPLAPRVLHIDGDGDAALVLATLLVPETRVTHVATLAEARRAIQDGGYALVVLDPDLPDGDGASLLAALNGRPDAPPVLLYSARQPPHDATAAAFLPKPWTSPRELWRTVAGLLAEAVPAA
ncbi:response regulator [Rugamonas sp. CCM 8940]|uniref:response regulator n=1 Tax=Rugamonas sp. CCM 8940 TaxID=2765359 RepID=UPI0018F590BD|nr:response regulator [Rugamonas sp. CCM 8940]MBJ7314143.1 response regulator [Rugamonas sp. CCM 8940]